MRLHSIAHPPWRAIEQLSKRHLVLRSVTTPQAAQGIYRNRQDLDKYLVDRRNRLLSTISFRDAQGVPECELR
jgi:hypothetical protein